MEQELKRDQEWEADFVKKQQKKKSDSESEKSDELPASVQEEIEDLCYYVPEVTNHFNVLDKIGEGTFSSVFMASLKHPNDVKEKFALKHIIPTSHPTRMISELKSLQLLGGKKNVIGVELCLKNRDHVVIIMRYFPHQKFLEYFNTFEVSEVRNYMKNLLLALQHIHQYDIIHRDVKPTNFLHNTETKKYALVDFGLAQDAPLKLREENQNKPSFLVFSKSSEKENTEEGRAEESNSGDKKGSGRAPLSPLPQGKAMSPKARGHLEVVTTQSPTLASPRRASRNRVPISPPPLLSKSRQRAGRPQQSVTKDDNGGRACHKSGTTGKGDSARRTPQKSATTTKGDNGGRGKEKAASVDDRAGRSQQKTVTAKSGDKFEAVPKSGQFIWSCNQQGGKVPSKIQAGGRKKRGGKCLAVKRDRQATCACYGRPTVCSHCTHRPNETAHRAGTPGFRAPEVLMKHPHQSTAVDIWAAGVIFLSLLSGRYPFFRGNDDMTCLCQIISLLGTEAVKKAALSFDKLVTSKPETRPLELKSLCERLRAANSKSADAKQPPEPTKQWAEVPESAVHLLKQMLDPSPATRITAEEALASEFIAEGRKC